ncbi:MAG: hypothetical protein LBM19_00015 [Holosporales bacterium]|nr:hypothetical protein [Holosporales bacterium]
MWEKKPQRQSYRDADAARPVFMPQSLARRLHIREAPKPQAVLARKAPVIRQPNAAPVRAIAVRKPRLKIPSDAIIWE